MRVSYDGGETTSMGGACKTGPMCNTNSNQAPLPRQVCSLKAACVSMLLFEASLGTIPALEKVYCFAIKKPMVYSIVGWSIIEHAIETCYSAWRKENAWGATYLSRAKVPSYFVFVQGRQTNAITLILFYIIMVARFFICSQRRMLTSGLHYTTSATDTYVIKKQFTPSEHYPGL